MVSRNLNILIAAKADGPFPAFAIGTRLVLLWLQRDLHLYLQDMRVSRRQDVVAIGV